LLWGFKPIPLILDTGLAVEFRDFVDLIESAFWKERGVGAIDGDSVSHLPGLSFRDDGCPEGIWKAGAVGHGRSPGKETAKGLAKKLSGNVKVTLPNPSTESSPGEVTPSEGEQPAPIRCVVWSGTVYVFTSQKVLPIQSMGSKSQPRAEATSLSLMRQLLYE